MLLAAMRFSQISSYLLPTILLSQQAIAGLIPELLQGLDPFHSLEKRCDKPCGYYGQLCCASNQYCYTDANGQAACGSGAVQSGGSWQYVTTTYVQTDLKTVVATYSTYVPAVTQSPTVQCSYAQGQSSCGSTCCNSGYYCQANNMCVQVPGGSSGYYSNVYTVTTVVTNTAGVPLRPTTQTILTLTSGTTAYQTPVSTNGVLVGASEGNGGLSGGAIAGIVIGVIAGIILLLLICLCCCAKELIDGFLGIFGFGKKKRVTEETIIEERHSRRSGGRWWFGQRPSRTEAVEVEEKKSGFGRKLGVATFLGTTALILGLKRKNDRDNKSSSSYDSYYSYDYTSDSSPSSITRTSRRSRSHR